MIIIFFKVQVQLHRSCARIPPPIFFVLVHEIHEIVSTKMEKGSREIQAARL